MKLVYRDEKGAPLTNGEVDSNFDIASKYLETIEETKSVTAVDVFVYDTSKDSDGGAWRQRTQHTSWYNEALNTATRGSRKEFPAVAVIVAESNKVTIYDGDDPSMPMWMVFDGANNSASMLGQVVSSVVFINGTLWVGLSSFGVSEISFLSDVAWRHRANTGSAYYGKYKGDLLNRNGISSFNRSNYLGALVNDTVNDIAMTVLPDAPIDPATGLPIPTIAVATDGGVSVIKDDGSVVDSARNNSNQVFCNEKGIFFNADYDQTVTFASWDDIYSGDGFGDVIGTSYNSAFPIRFYNRARDIVGIKNNLTISETSNINFGLQHVDNPYEGTGESMSAYLSSTYNTGWMNGDIKLATLSDTDDTDLVASGELVTNGTFDTDTSGWTAYRDATLTLVDNSLHIQGGQDNTLTGAYTTIQTEVGKTYSLEVNLQTTSGNRYILVGSQPTNANAKRVYNYDFKTGTHSYNFKAVSETTYIGFYVYLTTQSITIDNVSVRLAEPDRSVNNNGLQVFGTVQKNPVATGADLVAYLPTGGGRLEQPYNSDLDFGTGDFCYMGWGRLNNTSSRNIVSRQHPYGAGIGVNAFAVGYHTAAGSVRVQTGSGAFLSGYAPPSESTWTHVCAVRKDGVLYIYVNGELQSSHSFTNNVDNPDAKVYAGSLYYNNTYTDTCQAALLKISATAPTAEQIAKIYRDEKVLFQDGAQATLYGTSDAVTALAYDDTTELLHVGTSGGRSVFQGLKRVDNTTDAVGTAISASNNLVVEE